MNDSLLILKGIPGDVKRKFHVACVENNISMKQVVVLCMKSLSDPAGMLKFLLDQKERGEI